MSRKVNIEKTVSKIEALQTKINNLLANIKNAANPEDAKRRAKDRVVHDDSELHARVRKNAKKPAKKAVAEKPKRKKKAVEPTPVKKPRKKVMEEKPKRKVKKHVKPVKSGKKPSKTVKTKRKHVELTGD